MVDVPFITFFYRKKARPANLLRWVIRETGTPYTLHTDAKNRVLYRTKKIGLFTRFKDKFAEWDVLLGSTLTNAWTAISENR